MATYASSLIEALRTPTEFGSASGVSLLANPVSPAMAAYAPRARPMSYLQATTPLSYTPGVDYVDRPVVPGGSSGRVPQADLGYMESISSTIPNVEPQILPTFDTQALPTFQSTTNTTDTSSDQQVAVTSPVTEQGAWNPTNIGDVGIRQDIVNAINLADQVPVMEQLKQPVIESTITGDGQVLARTTTANEANMPTVTPIELPTFTNQDLVTQDEVDELINQSIGAIQNLPTVQEISVQPLQPSTLEVGPLVTDEEVEQLIQDNLELLIPGGNWKAYQQLNKGAPTGEGIPLDEEEELLRMLGRGET